MQDSAEVDNVPVEVWSDPRVALCHASLFGKTQMSHGIVC